MFYLIHPRVEDRPHPATCEEHDSSTPVRKGLPVSSQVVFVGMGNLSRKKEGLQERQAGLQIPTMPFT